MLQLIVTVIVVALTARVLFAIKYVRSFSGLNVVPIPPGLKFWFTGHMDRITLGGPLNGIRHTYVPASISLISQFDMPLLFTPGPLVKFQTTIFMTDPVAIRESFSSQYMYDLHKGPEYESVAPLLGKGILSDFGDNWKRQRKICDLGFANSMIRSSVDKSAMICNQATQRFLKFKNSTGKILIDANTELALITTDVMGEMIFGVNFNGVNSYKPAEAPLYHAFKTVIRILGLKHIQQIKKHFPSFELNNNLDVINKLVDDVVQAERSNKSQKSGTLLSYIVHGDNKGEKLTEREIKDNVKTFMFAGQDTTSSALSWTLYYLSLYPEIQRKAREEIDSVIGTDRTKMITYEMVKTELVYINYIMKEVLRFHPSAIFSKKTVKDITLPGSDGKSYNIPRGVVLHYNPMFVQLNKKYWGEDALEFKPDRWHSMENEKDLSMKYFPFSFGHRSCIGMNFAKAEFVTIVAKILQSFEIKLTDETMKRPPIPIIDITISPSDFTLELVERQ